MAGLKELLGKCIIIGSNLSPAINSERYLSVLSDESAEINYSVFRAFACASSNTILAVLYRLGYFGNYAELLHIAGEIIEMREAFDHEEEDADGLIAFLLSNHRGNRLNDRNTSATDGREPPSQLRKRPAEEELETGTLRRARSAENDSEADITASPVQRGGGGGQNEEATPEERVTQLCNNEGVTDEDENEEEVVGEERCNPSSETEDGEEEPEVAEEQQRHEVGVINFNYVDLLTENMRQFRRFGIIGREASFAIRPIREGSNIYHTLENAFREIHAYVLNLCEPGDYAGMTFHSPNLSQGPAGLSFRLARDISYDDIWKLVSSVAQSAGGLDIAEHFNIRVFNITVPSGRGRVKLTNEDVVKRSIVTINNSDNLCFPRALVVARIYCERGNLRTGALHEKWNNIRHPHSPLQREFALQLTRNAGVTITEEGCGIPEIDRFQRYLAADNIAIVVYNFSTFGRGEKPMYDGIALLASLDREPSLRLNIMYYERLRHYNPIINLNAAVGCRNYCEPCNIGYRNDKTGHRCPNKCPRCFTVPSCKQSESIKCNVCNRAFFGKKCFERHRSVKSYDGKSTESICNVVRFCDGCGRIVKFGARHECGVSYCKLCRSPKPENHLCYMQPLRRDNDSSTVPSSSSSTMAPAMTVTRSTEESTEFDGKVANDRACTSKKERVAFVFYDFETRQDESLEGTSNVKKHVPTLCVAQQICEACAKENNLSARCRWCGVREFVFRHDPVKQFVDFATRTTKYFKQIICIAHNAKAFDAQFILKYIVENRNNLEPKLILNGTKIVVLTVGHTKFIDSVNYMPMRLSELPKAFGLQDTSDKGIFPHLFNTVENQSYVGPLPDAHYYSPETMKSEERERFLVWHADMRQKNTVFDFQREIIRYCRTDVDILRQACMAFRKIFIVRGNVCPFEECTTIASTCMTVFRKNFLQQNTIGVIPTGGYRKATNHSRKALQWLIWKERELGHSINHAGRSREYRTIDGTLVDGYYETPDTETPQRHVLQFHGCFWHGCPSCFPMNRDRPLSTSDCKDTIDSRYERTLAISWRLRQRKYFVIEKWECSFDRDMRDSREMREYLENHPMVETPPLDPRDAFFGGRTGNIVTRYEVTGAFPIGHPDIYVGEECSALIGRAPNYNFNTCCETLSQSACTHNDAKEREFEGTWVSCELRKAVEKGYHVTAVSEIWQYKVSQFDHTTRQGGLFAEYINTFLQLKQEASGWPSECGENDDDAKERYLREYEKTEGIVLDKRNVARNPGLRSVAKLCLNSFWGKFGQRSNLPNTEVVRTPQRFIALLTSAEHEITDILPVNDEVIYVSWRLRQEAVVSSPLTNVVIAAYTTAQARLTLYSYLERLDRRVLYYDTDSCIYVSSGDPNEYEPRTGNFLGDMTDELESYGSGSYIEAFVSGGPKFYAYVVRSPDGRTHEACKVKGITLNYENSRLVNFNSIRNLLLNKERVRENEENEKELAGTSINLRFRAIRRTAFHEIVTRDETKVCEPVLLKRRFIDSHCSLPYGYIIER
ncbi:uncharacterized protein [Polyergus mexicanus]|uniref:uncharacterized protein n=1 Tax=Polyergus mexicanus TaxID=615972 RepID=UPI0038B4F06F